VSGVTDVLKTPAACRDIDLHSSIAKMLDDFIGGRNSGFLIQTENGTMLSPENFFRGGFESALKKMGKQACASMHSVASVKRCCKKARLGNSSSITGWAMRTTT